MTPTPNYHCPVCGKLSTLILGPEQAFCTNTDEDCRVISFNPSLPDGGGLHPIDAVNFDWIKKDNEPE